MARFEIIANGTRMGIHEGTDADDALDAYARDAGYADFGDACAVVESDGSDVRAVELEIMAPKDTDSAPRQIDSARLSHVPGSVAVYGCELWTIDGELDRRRMWRRTESRGGLAPWYQEVRAS